MLMGNASKILQTVCANIDRDIMDPALTNLMDLVLLTDTSGMLQGTETVTTKGVAVAMQRETMRARQLEFLQLTANPIDAAIMGPKGRAAVLRNVSHTIGMPGEDIVPSDDEIAQQQAQAKLNAEQAGQAGHSQEPPEGAAPGDGERDKPGGPPSGGGGTPPQQGKPGGESEKAQAPRTATFMQRPRGR